MKTIRIYILTICCVFGAMAFTNEDTTKNSSEGNQKITSTENNQDIEKFKKEWEKEKEILKKDKEKTRKLLEDVRETEKELRDLLKNRIRPKKVLINGWDSKFLVLELKLKGQIRSEESENPIGKISINGFNKPLFINGIISFRRYLLEGENKFIITFSDKFIENNSKKSFKIQISSQLKPIKEYNIPFEEGKTEYKISLKIDKMPVKLSWYKAKSWTSLPASEKRKISEIVMEYYKTQKSNDLNKQFGFGKKYRSLYLKDYSIMQGYPADHVNWDIKVDANDDSLKTHFIDHIESGVSDRIQIKPSNENDKVVVVSTKDLTPVFNLYYEGDNGEPVQDLDKNIIFLNFICVDGRWDIY